MRRAWVFPVLAASALAQESADVSDYKRPSLSASGVVNAADYRAGPVAPSEIVVLYPTGAGPSQMATWELNPLHLTPYYVDPVGSTRVLFDGVAAPIVYAESGRICAIVPYSVAGKKSTQVVVEYAARRSLPVVLAVAPSAPAVFTLDASGSGQAAMLNETGCCNSVRNPAMRGTIVSLYATGEGLPLAGAAKSAAAGLPVGVTVGSVPAPVLWKDNVGLLMVNFRVPLDAPVGDAIPLVLSVGNARSSAPATMAIRSERRQILIAARDLAVRRPLLALLSAAGYDVFAAGEGEEAVRLAGNRNVDLVIADLTLPEEERTAMMRAIRGAHPLARILAVGELGPDSLKAADLLGAQAVVSRPLTAQRVMPRVRELLLRRPAVY